MPFTVSDIGNEGDAIGETFLNLFIRGERRPLSVLLRLYERGNENQ
jgi:hypothetical protein